MARRPNILILVLLCLLWTPAPSAEQREQRSGVRQTVVLLHGLGRTDRSMRPLEVRLTEAGFRVHNLGYRSTVSSPEELVEDLRKQVDECCTESSVLHFVGHSLGGILIRAYLAEEQEFKAGRVVMLAPPNGGSELVDALGNSALFRWALGPTAQQLGTDSESLPNRLPEPEVEIGVIAGKGSVNPLGSLIIPDEDDGMVSVASTKLEGMTDFLVVPDSHAFIMRSDDVAEQVVHFLRHGKFRQGETEPQDTCAVDPGLLALEGRDPVADASEAVAGGQAKLLAVAGFRVDVPGTDLGYDCLRAAGLVRLIPDTSDALRCEAHARLQGIARDYASGWNQRVLQQRSFVLPTGCGLR